MAAVLVPIDGSALSRLALPWAGMLAGPGGAAVLLRVIEPSLFGENAVAANVDLDAAAADLAGTNVTIEREVATGDAAEEIVHAAARRGIDLIVMASHGRGAVGRTLFGSAADRVSRVASVPVLILRVAADAPQAPDVRRIIAPLDGSALANLALPVATRLARQLNIPVHVVRAVDASTMLPVAPGVFGASPLVSAEIADRVWEEAEAEAKSTIATAVEQLRGEGVAATGAVLTGSPFFAISDAVAPGDLIVLTSHGRGGVRRWLLGSIAEKLVREAPAPVLLVPAPEREMPANGVLG